MQDIQMLVEFDSSRIAGGDLELLLMIAHPDTLACHGIFTLRKVKKIEYKRELIPNRKRQAPRETVIANRKERMFECVHCEYASPARYLTARHVARTHLKSIPSTKCKLYKYQTI